VQNLLPLLVVSLCLGVIANGLAGCEGRSQTDFSCSLTSECQAGEVCAQGSCQKIEEGDSGPEIGIDSGAVDDAGAAVVVDAGLDAGLDGGALSDAAVMDGGSGGTLHDPPWWQDAYGKRQAIAITAANEAIQPGETLWVSIPHAMWVGGGLSCGDGSDVRLVRWNGVLWNEVDRVTLPERDWNHSGADTQLAFSTAVTLPANATHTGYFLYYEACGAPLAPPPQNGAGVFSFFESFDGILPHPDYFQDAPGSVVTTGGGQTSVDMQSDPDAGFIVGSTRPLPPWTRPFSLRSRVAAEAMGGVSLPEIKLLSITQGQSPPDVTDNAIENVRRRLQVQQKGDGEARIFYFNASHTHVFWTGTVWTTTDVIQSWGNLPLGVPYVTDLEGDGADFRIRIHDADGGLIEETAPAPFSDLEDNGDAFYFYVGEPYANYYWANFTIDDVWLSLNPSGAPLITLGPVESP
jgi:hypothetical protein